MSQHPALAAEPTWVRMPTKFAFSILNGSTPSSSEMSYWDGDIFWATPEDIGAMNGKVLRDTRRKITETGYQNSGTRLAPAGSIVLTTRAPVGNLAIAGMALCTNQGCKTLVPNDAVDASFAYYQFLARRNELEMLAAGTTFQELSSEKLSAFELLLPPLVIQRAIAAYLDQHTARLDDLIATKQQLLTVLAEKRQALITHAVTRGLDPAAPLRASGVPWLGEIPAHWEVTEVRRVVEHIEQGWSPQADELEPAEDEWGVVKLNAVKNGTFDPSKAKTIPSDLEVPSALAIKPGDFLVTRANTPELVGDVCHVHNTPPKLILSDLIYRLSIDTSKIDGDFLSYFLQSTVGRIQIESDARGSSASMVKISQNHVMSWLVPIPPLDEQAGMARYLNSQIAKLDALQVAAVSTIELLQERRSALIAAAVTGQIEVTEPSCN